MNKYLSYEKSKRLAELGYKPEQPMGVDRDEIAKPDCHDLLMELQKYVEDNEKTNLAIYKKSFMLDNWYQDENPVEALGAALIKLLEKKND